MSQQLSRGHCPSCDCKVLAVKEPVNHLLHAAISFLSCGLWVIPWLALQLMNENEPWRCKNCGDEVAR